MNIYDYILKYKDDKLIKINTVDAMVFARLSYIHIEKILEKIPLTISELAKYIELLKTNSRDKKLVYLLKDTTRYKDLMIERCENIFDEEKEEQFTAITISLPKNNLFIAFRGTNKSIVGYKEDLNMSFMTIPSQISALSYVNREKNFKNIYLGGHSKGGNLAMYAGINANFIKRFFIKKVYNFDGPGFLKINNEFNKIKNKLLNFFPENSFVGTLMYNDAPVEYVKVLKDGFDIHNLYYWQVRDSDLEKGLQSINSVIFHDNCLTILKTISKEKREAVIDYIYQLVLEGRIKSIKELKIEDFSKLINNAPKLSKNDKKLLFDFIKSLMKCLISNTKKV